LILVGSFKGPGFAVFSSRGPHSAPNLVRNNMGGQPYAHKSAVLDRSDRESFRDPLGARQHLRAIPHLEPERKRWVWWLSTSFLGPNYGRARKSRRFIGLHVIKPAHKCARYSRSSRTPLFHGASTLTSSPSYAGQSPGRRKPCHQPQAAALRLSSAGRRRFRSAWSENGF
jgi:hypothetical protein